MLELKADPLTAIDKLRLMASLEVAIAMVKDIRDEGPEAGQRLLRGAWMSHTAALRKEENDPIRVAVAVVVLDQYFKQAGDFDKMIERLKQKLKVLEATPLGSRPGMED